MSSVLPPSLLGMAGSTLSYFHFVSGMWTEGTLCQFGQGIKSVCVLLLIWLFCYDLWKEDSAVIICCSKEIVETWTPD